MQLISRFPILKEKSESLVILPSDTIRFPFASESIPFPKQDFLTITCDFFSE